MMKEIIKKLVDKVWRLSDDFDYEIIHTQEHKPFRNETPRFTDAGVNESYSGDNTKWLHTEYIKRLKKRIIIEPDYSYGITQFNKIISTSAFYSVLKPSFPRYVFSLLRNKKIKVPKAVLFDGQVGANYFHFFSDILNKIWLMPRIEDPENIPLIIGERVYNTRYFQHLLANSGLGKYNWLIQKKGEYIEVEELYFIKPMPYRKAYFNNIKQLLNIEKNDVNEKKVFLNRSMKSGRYIDNFHEIEPVLKKFGFEIIDTDNTTLDFQANLFNSVKHLISIHGAGETNIIFANENLRFLEINPANRIACQYYWLSLELGIEYYDIILGGALPETNIYPEKGFYLDPEKLEAAINRMVN